MARSRWESDEGAMAQVSVSINGRQYRIVELRGKFGQIGDARLIVMAALTVADDLVEMGKKVRQLEDEIAALQDSRVVSADRVQANHAAIAAAFNSAADRVESIARKLNKAVAENNVAMG